MRSAYAGSLSGQSRPRNTTQRAMMNPGCPDKPATVTPLGIALALSIETYAFAKHLTQSQARSVITAHPMHTAARRCGAGA